MIDAANDGPAFATLSWTSASASIGVGNIQDAPERCQGDKSMQFSPMKAVSMTAALGLVVSFMLVVGCSKTTTTDEAGRKLSIASPADQTIVQGNTNKVLITITRTNFNERVEIDVDDLPSGIDLADDDRFVAVDDNTVTVTLVADQDAKIVQDHLVKVTAEGPGDLEVSEFFKLTVAPKN